MPAERIAILDACVLVQAPLRDTLLRLAELPALYQPRWSDEIIAEMKRALENQIGLAPAKTAYLERELRRHFADCWVSDFEPLVRKMTNHSKDRHVLAAAVRANAQTVVTFNKRHFPPAATSPWNLEAVGPSAFLEALYADSPAIVVERIRQQAADLDRSLSEQLTVLAKAVPSFVDVLRHDVHLRGQ
ncbi:MAG TPA: PIN domain-containing protein [Solibacterales bacterium]|nr:PIN domain-containing protein [Bryobacterales bacterium]